MMNMKELCEKIDDAIEEVSRNSGYLKQARSIDRLAQRRIALCCAKLAYNDRRGHTPKDKFYE